MTVQTRTADDVFPLPKRTDNIVVGTITGQDRSKRGAYTYSVDVQNAAGNIISLRRVREAIPGYVSGFAGRISVGSRVQLQKYSRTLWQIVGIFSSPDDWGSDTEPTLALETATSSALVSDQEGAARAEISHEDSRIRSVIQVSRDGGRVHTAGDDHRSGLLLGENGLEVTASEFPPGGDSVLLELRKGVGVIAQNDRLYLQLTKRGNKGEIALMPTSERKAGKAAPAQNAMRVPLEVLFTDTFAKFVDVPPQTVAKAGVPAGSTVNTATGGGHEGHGGHNHSVVLTAFALGANVKAEMDTLATNAEKTINDLREEINDKIVDHVNNELLKKIWKSEVQLEHIALGRPAAPSVNNTPAVNVMPITLQQLAEPAVSQIAASRGSFRVNWAGVANAVAYRVAISIISREGISSSTSLIVESPSFTMAPADIANQPAIALLTRHESSQFLGSGSGVARLGVYATSPMTTSGVSAGSAGDLSLASIAALAGVELIRIGIAADETGGPVDIFGFGSPGTPLAALDIPYSTWLITIAISALADAVANEYADSPIGETKIGIAQIPFDAYGAVFVR